MNGSMMAYLTIATMFFLGCLVILTRMVLDYRSRESLSRGSQIQAQMEMMAAMVRQSGEVVKTQTELTELILVGRPAEPISLQQPSESPTVTLPNSNELFRDLPDNIKEAMLREVEEEATWPSPWEKPLEESEDRTMEAMEELLRSASPTASKSTWVPQPEESN
jgi:hypothetical protein